MADLTSKQLDTLFFDEDEMDIDTPLRLCDTAFEFLSMPPELRSIVYEYFYKDYVTLNVLRINAKGEMPSPAILHVSKQIRYETARYLPLCNQKIFAKEYLLINAQVYEYNFTLLLNRFDILSGGDKDLFRRASRNTIITFHGAINMANIATWIQTCAYEQTCYFIEQKPPENSPLGHIPALLDGGASLGRVVWTHSKTPPKHWKARALSFLSNISSISAQYNRGREQQLFPPKRMDLGLQSDVGAHSEIEEVATMVFEVVAQWHHYLSVMAGGRMRAGGMKLVREEKAEMEMAVWQFCDRCDRV